MKKAIVIGGDHHNTLGVIRSLGQENFEVYLILISNKSCNIAKSKYVKRFWLVKECEKNIMEILLNEFIGEGQPVIIPTSDFAVSIIDNNLEKLKERYLTSNIGEIQGQINYLMNKERMNKIAEKAGFSVPKSCVIRMNSFEEIDYTDIIYPCIVKPLKSIDGKKEDIKKCASELDLKEWLNFMKTQYESVLVQEFIDKEDEFGIIGCVLKGSKELIIPGVIKKIREYPLKSGSSSFALITKDNDKLDLKVVERFLRETNYTGVFDMEFLYANGKVYFLEVNFRNGGNGYVLTRAGVNLINLWCCEALGEDISEKQKVIEKNTYFMMDTRDFRHVLNGDLGLIQWVKDLFQTRAFLFLNFKDMKPYISKLLNR